MSQGKESESGAKTVERPRCASPEVSRILYGLPAFSERLERNLDASRVILGGCVVW